MGYLFCCEGTVKQTIKLLSRTCFCISDVDQETFNVLCVSCVCVCVCYCADVCVCVCERERESVCVCLSLSLGYKCQFYLLVTDLHKYLFSHLLKFASVIKPVNDNNKYNISRHFRSAVSHRQG